MLCLELKNSNDAYSSKLQSGHYKEKDFISFVWKVKEISQFDEMNVTGASKKM